MSLDNTNFVHVDVRLTDNRARAGFKTTAKAVTPDNAARLAAAKYFECRPSEVTLRCDKPGNKAARRKRLYTATRKPNIRTCRSCGCTHTTPCVNPRTGETCHWVAKDLCSACDGTKKPLRLRRVRKGGAT